MTDSASKSSVTIKKYANRRLYNTATSTYVTLENLAVMVKEGTEFNVYDAKTGEDITRSVLTQIIVEEEGKSGQNLLPVGFLRQLISFYGDNMQWMVPKYLEQSMQTLTHNQDQLRSYFQNSFGSMFPFGTTLEEMGKQNMAMFERAMRMFSPFTGMAGMPGMPDSTASAAPMSGKMSPETHAEEHHDQAAPATTEEPADSAEPPVSIHNSTASNASAARGKAEKKTAAEPVAEVETIATTPSFRSASGGSAVAAKVASTASSPEDMQVKISNLQKQLAELAKNRG